MPYLSRQNIEAIAVRVTNDYKNLIFSLNGQPVSRIDPEVLACDLCGFSINHFHLSKDNTILGMTSLNEIGVYVYDDDEQAVLYYFDGKTILIEKTIKDDPAQYGRYNFTVMHETAHQILGRSFPEAKPVSQRHSVYYREHTLQYPVHDWREWQADNLASALLLPIDIVLRALHRFDLAQGIDILNRIYRPKEYRQFCDMAKFLGVSKQAMAIRLKRLGLLKKEYLQNPYALANIEEDDECWPNL